MWHWNVSHNKIVLPWSLCSSVLWTSSEAASWVFHGHWLLVSILTSAACTFCRVTGVATEEAADLSSLSEDRRSRQEPLPKSGQRGRGRDRKWGKPICHGKTSYNILNFYICLWNINIWTFAFHFLKILCQVPPSCHLGKDEINILSWHTFVFMN